MPPRSFGEWYRAFSFFSFVPCGYRRYGFFFSFLFSTLSPLSKLLTFMKLKLCGIRNLHGVQCANRVLAEYIGLNFVPTSRRRVDIATAVKLEQSFLNRSVAVVQNPTVEELDDIIAHTRIQILQFHGQEDADFISRYPGLIRWKALPVDGTITEQTLTPYKKSVHMILFDGARPGSGQRAGTQELEQAVEAARSVGIPYGLAGGITPENIAGFRAAFPDAQVLDTASGIEVDGVVDMGRCQELAHNLRQH